MAITQGTAGSGGGGGGGGVITDVQDGTGDSVMDAVNNAVRVNVVTGATSGGSTETTLAAINTTVGATTDAGVVTDTTGTVIGFLRGNIIKWVALLARLPAALTGGGNFKISIQEQAGTLTVGDGAGSLTVDGTVAVTNANLDAALSTLGTQTTLAAILAKILAAPATEATLALIKAKTDNIDVALSSRTKAADAQHAIIDSGTVAVTNANLDAALSTLATQAGAGATSDAKVITDANGSRNAFLRGAVYFWSLVVDQTNNGMKILGAVAHGAADAGGPVKVGRKSIAHGTNPTAVTAGQLTNLYANRAGVPFQIGGHPNIQTFRNRYTTAQTDVAQVTVGAGTIIVLTSFMFTCDNANTVNVNALLGFGTATVPTGAGNVGSHAGIAPGSAFGRGNGAGMIGVGADNEDLRVTVSVPTGGNVDVFGTYYTIES